VPIGASSEAGLTSQSVLPVRDEGLTARASLQFDSDILSDHCRLDDRRTHHCAFGWINRRGLCLAQLQTV
jgi:hypothetical protein